MRQGIKAFVSRMICLESRQSHTVIRRRWEGHVVVPAVLESIERGDSSVQVCGRTSLLKNRDLCRDVLLPTDQFSATLRYHFPCNRFIVLPPEALIDPTLR